MLLETNKSTYEYCLAKKTVNLIRDANRGCLSADQLGLTVLLNNQFQAMLQFEPPGTVITPGYVSMATLDFSSFSSYGDLVIAVVVDSVVIASLPEGNYPNEAALLTAIALSINTTSTQYTSEYVGGGILTISVVTPGTSLNGTTVTVVINPTFFATENVMSGRGGNIQVVNNPASSLYGKLVFGGTSSATFTGANIRVFDNGTELGSSPIIPGQSQYCVPPDGYLYSLSTFITAFNETDNNFFITGRTYGKYTIMDQNYGLLTNPGYLTSPPDAASLYYSLTLYNPFGNAVWNPVNNRIYLTQGAASQTPNSLRYYDTAFTFPYAQNGTLTGAWELTVNTNSGDIWVCGAQDVYIVNTANALIDTIAGAANIKPVAITYNPNDDIMYVVFRNSLAPATSFVRSYDGTTHAVITPSLYTVSIDATSGAIFYSNIFNVLFVNNQYAQLHTDVIELDGTLKTSIPITSKSENVYFAEDVKNNKVWSISSENTVAEDSTVLRYFELGSEGEESISALFYGGVDPVISTGDENCLSQDQVNAGVQKLNKECVGCTTDVEPQVIPPSGTQYVIYYGKSTLTTLTDSQVEALGSVTATTYIGTYNYVAGALTYVYFAYPQILGTPSRFKDLLGGMDVVMETPFSVTINDVIYTVYRSYYTLSSTQSMEVQG